MQWNKVTWYSRLGALILFIGVLPALSFYIGTQFGRLQAEGAYYFDQSQTGS
jgi:hypothetical protein